MVVFLLEIYHDYTVSEYMQESILYMSFFFIGKIPRAYILIRSSILTIL